MLATRKHLVAWRAAREAALSQRTCVCRLAALQCPLLALSAEAGEDGRLVTWCARASMTALLAHVAGACTHLAAHGLAGQCLLAKLVAAQHNFLLAAQA